MSDSAILDIFIALSKLDLGAVKTRSLPELDLPVGELPLRMLLPPTGNGEFVLVGATNRMEWSIRDLTLWAPLGSSDLKAVAEPLLRFAQAHLAALRGLRGPTSQSHISGWTYRIGPVIWDEAQFWACDVTETVEEIL